MKLPSLLLLFSFSFLFSDNYYVSAGGTDNASCSVSNPCEHIQTAINLLKAQENKISDLSHRASFLNKRVLHLAITA